MIALYLLRHAKSAWDDHGLADAERPLAPRGRRAAPAMAAHMEAEGLVPRRVLCSPAVRTRETWALMAPTLGADIPVELCGAIYGAPAGRLLDVVRERASGASPLLLVGHNPGMQDLAEELAGDGDPDAMARLRRKFPTGALAVLEADVGGWDELAPGGARLARFVAPKDLADAEALGL